MIFQTLLKIQIEQLHNEKMGFVWCTALRGVHPYGPLTMRRSTIILFMVRGL